MNQQHLENLENWQKTIDELRERETLIQHNLDKYIQTQNEAYLDLIVQDINQILRLIRQRDIYFNSAFT